ncbi:MAG: hypothetical protein K8I60_14365 [Anaerolineae bacterium]|nr:hypothetical protein [Anaerolineae bacterium]
MPTVPTFSITLPPAQPPRDTYFCLRLTPAEKASLHALAKQLHLPTSTLARHILLQAVQQSAGEETSHEA